MGLLFALLVCILVTWVLIEWVLWLHRWCDWREAERKRPKQVQLDDLLGTRNYNGPLG